MNINLIKTSASLTAIAGILAAASPAKAAALGACDAVSPALPHVYVAGSSAVKPFIVALGTALKDTSVVVYLSQGSCVGVTDVFDANAVLPTATNNGTVGADTCDIPANTKAHIGVSDVFATSCDGVEEVPAGVGDFQGPIQVMNFVVPKLADASIQSISAEAAYLVFGFDPTTNDAATGKSYADGTPWTAKADIFMRGSGSGTQSMLGKAIGVPPGAWALNNNAANALASSALMVTAIGNATNHDTTIGILASNELDNSRDNIRGLAFQAAGQSCGYWPDSSSSAKDKLNARTGKYDVWGPLHMYTKVGANKKPTVAAVADLIDYISGAKTLEGLDVVALETAANLIPQCAMQVSRDSEVGDLASVNPTCTCYYDNARGGDTDGCVECTDNTDCDDGKSCSYGYCEAI